MVTHSFLNYFILLALGTFYLGFYSTKLSGYTLLVLFVLLHLPDHSSLYILQFRPNTLLSEHLILKIMALNI